jgi:MFS transporter, DHA3 family, macrolide efflux protein
VLVTLHAVATAVFGPTLTAAAPSLVSPSQYTAANAWLQITTSLGIIMGPVFSGLGIATLRRYSVLMRRDLSDLRRLFCARSIRTSRRPLGIVSRPPVLSTWQWSKDYSMS